MPPLPKQVTVAQVLSAAEITPPSGRYKPTTLVKAHADLVAVLPKVPAAPTPRQFSRPPAF